MKNAFRGIGLAAGLLALLPATAGAATITVGPDTDELNMDGDCSLREAVQSAEDNGLDTTGCVNGDAAALDTIVLGAGTYTLTIASTDEDQNLNGDLDFVGGGPVLVQGAGAANTRINEGGAGARDRIVNVTGSLAVTFQDLTISDGDVNAAVPSNENGGNIALTGSTAFTLSGVTVASGDTHDDGAGGGLHTGNNSTVTIEDSQIGFNNDGVRGGGINIASGAVVSIVRSRVFDNDAASSGTIVNGGGINNSGGTLTVTDSVVSDNEAIGTGVGVNGGGIYSSGAITVLRSLIRANTSFSNTTFEQGGGIALSGGGTIVNSTIYQNTANGSPGGGLYAFGAGAANVNHVTFLANQATGGGDHVSAGVNGLVNLRASIFPGAGGFVDLCSLGAMSATIQSAGYNVANHADSGECGFVGSDETSALPIGFADAASGPVDNGGATPTLALTTTSKALNRVPAADCAAAEGTDQRGYPRPFNGQPCDAGAYELLSCPGSTTPLNGPGGVPACLLPQPQPQPQPQPSTVPPMPTCAGKPATIAGTDESEVLRGTRSADVIAALGGKDTVRGLGGNDLICGGAGKDRLVGGAGKDRLLGEAGKDRLVGGGGKDLCKGGKGRDRASSCEREKSL